jgi:hypothetical protein
MTIASWSWTLSWLFEYFRFLLLQIYQYFCKRIFLLLSHDLVTGNTYAEGVLKEQTRIIFPVSLTCICMYLPIYIHTYILYVCIAYSQKLIYIGANPTTSEVTATYNATVSCVHIYIHIWIYVAYFQKLIQGPIQRILNLQPHTTQPLR